MYFPPWGKKNSVKINFFFREITHVGTRVYIFRRAHTKRIYFVLYMAQKIHVDS